MDSNTEDGFGIDIGRLYAQLEQLNGSRKPRGLRCPLVTVLVLFGCTHLPVGGKLIPESVLFIVPEAFRLPCL